MDAWAYFAATTRTDMKAILMIGTALVLCGARGPMGVESDAEWAARLVGTWEGDVGGHRYTEEWRQVDAGTYEGKSTTWSGEDPVATERIRLTAFADRWVYLASPGGRSVTAFVRTEADTDTWVFENKEHDFPKRIGYRFTGKDALTAWIAGASDKDGRMEFRLRRAK